jgi:F-box/leucine-rich repeat protein 16
MTEYDRIPPGCSQLTSSGLSNLIQLRQLEELELTNCPGSSKELVSYLRQEDSFSSQ